MAYRHVRRVRRIYLDGAKREQVLPKSNFLLIGPTGCGKTHLVELLAKPEQRKFAAEMVILALKNPPADLYALGGIAKAATFLGADAAPVLPALKALKPDYMKDAAKSVAEAIAEIEAKVEAGKK